MTILRALMLLSIGVGIASLGWFVLEVVLCVYDRCTRKEPRR